MSDFRSWAVRVLALWAALAAATAATGLIQIGPKAAGAPGGPLGPFTGLLVVNGLAALALAGPAARLAVSGWRRPAVLFALLFCVETGLSWVEAVFFNDFVRMSAAALAGMAGAGLIKAAIGAGAAAWLWRGSAHEAGDGRLVRPAALTGLCLVLLTGLYVVLYFAGGAGVAWSSPVVRAWYGEGMTIDPGALALVQLGRGAVWTGLAALLAVTVRGRTLTVAGLTGVAFAVLMAAPLLYPSAVIPWPVRQVHLVELALVNFVFGAVATLVLRRRAAPRP
ncbi:MAG: hypothetical protein ACK4VY_06050 [Brevundimonas sp.]